jgi:hypothetical protein
VTQRDDVVSVVVNHTAKAIVGVRPHAADCISRLSGPAYSTLAQTVLAYHQPDQPAPRMITSKRGKFRPLPAPAGHSSRMPFDRTATYVNSSSSAFCLPQIGVCEALGEPAVNRREKVIRQRASVVAGAERARAARNSQVWLPAPRDGQGFAIKLLGILGLLPSLAAGP